MEGESGALDNVLTLNPNDNRWPEVLEWKDDATYAFKNVRVRQVSPGQFEVLSAEVEKEMETPAEDQTAERASEKLPETPTRMGGDGGYNNPAVENLQL